VYVTHDQNEALAISDLIMLMDHGAIVETGLPQDIYRRPQAEFTANFIGVANAIDGTVRSAGADGVVVASPQGMVRGEAAAPLHPGDSVRAFIRPENFDLSLTRQSDDDWPGVVRYSIYQGDCWDYTIDVHGADVRVRVHRERTGLGHGDTVFLRPDGREAVIMPTRDGIVVPHPAAVPIA
jgi:iron(III) transport system ATP-binding protein